MYFKFAFLICFVSTIHCLPVPGDNTISNQDSTLIDSNDLKVPLSVDQAINSPPKVIKLEETTTTDQLFNNNDAPEEDKIFKLNDEDLTETSSLSASSKQNTGGIANVQSLIDQTNTISSNLETMIKDMTTNKRHASAAMLKLMLQNVKRLNTSLVRLNQRVSTMPIIGNPQASASSASSTSSMSNSVSNSVSNATYNAAAQINGVVTNIRTQLNSATNEINNLLQRMRAAIPGASSASKPANQPKP